MLHECCLSKTTGKGVDSLGTHCRLYLYLNVSSSLEVETSLWLTILSKCISVYLKGATKLCIIAFIVFLDFVPVIVDKVSNNNIVDNYYCHLDIYC